MKSFLTFIIDNINYNPQESINVPICFLCGGSLAAFCSLYFMLNIFRLILQDIRGLTAIYILFLIKLKCVHFQAVIVHYRTLLNWWAFLNHWL
jgi:hypothetical protein